MAKARSAVKFDSLLLARLGLAAVFLYAGISALLRPTDWIGYIPAQLVALSPIPDTTLLLMHSIFEILLGALLLIGWQVRILGVLAALNLLFILVFVGIDPVTFRDLGLIALALILATAPSK